MRDLEVYLHIPFCVRKCAYCDFLSAPAGRDVQRAYAGALQREIRGFAGRAAREYCVTTVFFGGGTPSILPASDIAAFMDVMREGFVFAPDAEVTIECNPGTADREKLRVYRDAGINRLSLGLQSANDKELAMLGRIHTWADFLRTYEDARAAGFDNINADLMSALPGQTAASWERTLRNVLALAPEHISAYSLIIEEGTPFYEKYHEDDEIRTDGGVPRFLPSEDAERRMYEMTEELLGEAGLRRYEISNYARPGCECRHNTGYWRGTEYMGFGLGASSLIAGNSGYTRLRNPDDLTAYLRGDFSGREMQTLTVQDRMEEFMFLGLRLTDGISETEFARRFGCRIDKIYGKVLEQQQRLGLLARREGRVFLTPRGIDLSNRVMAEFLFDA